MPSGLVALLDDISGIATVLHKVLKIGAH